MYGKLLGGLAAVVVASGAALVTQAGGVAEAVAGPVARPALTTTTAVNDPVTAAQRRLAELGYDVGPADGVAGRRTRFAVVAFQKVERLARTGVLDEATLGALAIATRPGALVAGGAPTRVEVDLTRQVLLFWRDGHLSRVLPVSTGDGRRYCTASGCERAVTPLGVFRVSRKVRGVDPGPLGRLYDPMFFHRGVAIHGAPDVPAHPASHGCVRIPMYASASLAAAVPLGTPVHVVAT